jgi:Holliday junction resolvase RusA-like endonuclease
MSFVQNEMKDVDNLLKFILDTLEMVVYSNNPFIYDVRSIKKAVAMMDQHTFIEVENIDAHLNA